MHPSERRDRGPKRTLIRQSLAPAIAALVIGCAATDEDSSTSSASRDVEPSSEATPPLNMVPSVSVRGEPQGTWKSL